MAICKNCGIEIPDGKEYCESCEKKQESSDLDDLLNTVTDEEFFANNDDDSANSFFSELENFSDFEELGSEHSTSDSQDAVESENMDLFSDLESLDANTEDSLLDSNMDSLEELPDDFLSFLGKEDKIEQELGANEYPDDEASLKALEEHNAESNDSNQTEKTSSLLDALYSDASEELPDSFFEDELKQEVEDLTKEDRKTTKKAKKQKVKAEKSVPKEKKEKKEKKENKFLKLFQNVPIDPSKIKPEPTPEEIEEKKKAAAAKKEAQKKEKELAADEKKKEAQKAKEEKKRLALLEKEEKKAKKMEEAKLVVEEMKTTRINRAGATIVFAFFAIIAVVIIIGTKMSAYSISIQHAETEFEKKRYNNAYEEIYGMKVKADEQLLYDKIMTVMYVQKQLNSYYNFSSMGSEEKALDSLVKGLQRYEKYVYLADELGITSDFDYVRSQLLGEIEQNFHLTEEETDNLVRLYNEGQKTKSSLKYSMAVYETLQKEKEE